MASKVIAFIPARKGSKRLPGKNKRLLCGKPLILYTLEQAYACEFIDEIIVSTNDEDIIKICREYKRDVSDPFLYNFKISIHKRPEEYCQDYTPINDVIAYELKGYPNTTHVILLQPTSPLRMKIDIEIAYKYYFLSHGRQLFPVVGCYFDYKNKLFKLNGIIFVGTKYYFSINALFDSPVIYTILKERSIDIDTLEDFEKAEKLMEKRLKL